MHHRCRNNPWLVYVLRTVTLVGIFIIASDVGGDSTPEKRSHGYRDHILLYNDSLSNGVSLSLGTVLRWEDGQ